MNEDLITKYMDYKINTLSNCGYLFFYGYNKRFILGKFRKYFTVFINTFFYHKLGTIDEGNSFGFNILKKELIGMKYELLDDYSNFELEVSNDLYERNCDAIGRMVYIVLLLCSIDRDIFNHSIDVDQAISNRLDKEIGIKKMLNDSDRLNQYFHNMKDMYNSVISFDKDSKFLINQIKLPDDSSYIVSLYPNMEFVKTKYKKSLIKKVYDNSKFSMLRFNELIYLLSKGIIQDVVDGNVNNRYFISIDENLYKNGFIFLDSITNPLYKEGLVFMIDYEFYMKFKDYLNTITYDFACLIDLTMCTDINSTLNDIDSLKFFKYIIVNNYNDSDKEVIDKFECQEGVSFFVFKEE